MKKLLILLWFMFILTSCKAEEPYVFRDVSYNYSIHSEFDLIVTKLPVKIPVTSISLDDNPVDLSNLIHNSDGLKLKSDYIQSLSLGEHSFLIVTDEGEFVLALKIINTSRPYIISKSSVETDFSTDLYFTFELFGGSIQAITGGDIKSTGYVITGNELRIRRGFIKNAFESDESLQTLVIGYTLEVDDNIVVGYIFIKKQSS